MGDNYILTTVLSPVLCMGVTIDTLNLLGIVPDLKILLIILFKGFAKKEFSTLIVIDEIPFNPEVHLFFRLFICRNILFLVTGFR